MCKCTPTIRTPFCGKQGCEWPGSTPSVLGAPHTEPINSSSRFNIDLNDSVDHPDHYNIGKIEVIDAIEDWKLGFNLGNAVKYIARAGKKDPEKLIEDLKKAAWYLDRQINAEIERVEKWKN